MKQACSADWKKLSSILITIPWPLSRYTLTAPGQKQLYPGLYLTTQSLLPARGSYTLASISLYHHCSLPGSYTLASVSLHPHCYSPEAAISWPLSCYTVTATLQRQLYPGLCLATPSLLLARGSYTLTSISLHSHCSPPEASIPWPLSRYTLTAPRQRQLYPGLYLATQ